MINLATRKSVAKTIDLKKDIQVRKVPALYVLFINDNYFLGSITVLHSVTDFKTDR